MPQLDTKEYHVSCAQQSGYYDQSLYMNEFLLARWYQPQPNFSFNILALDGSLLD